LLNLAEDGRYAALLERLKKQLKSELAVTGDPRETGQPVYLFEQSQYFGSGPRHPSF